MLQHVHPELEGVSEEYQKASIETLVALLTLGATTDTRSVTVERLRLEGIDDATLPNVLEQLVAAGIVRRIKYRRPNRRNFGHPCQPMSPLPGREPRYRLSDRIEVIQNKS